MRNILKIFLIIFVFFASSIFVFAQNVTTDGDCSLLNSQIQTLETKYSGLNLNNSTLINRTVNSIKSIITDSKSKNINTSNLEILSTEFQNKYQKFLSDADALIQDIHNLSAYSCPLDQNNFSLQLARVRSEISTITSDFNDLQSYYSNELTTEIIKLN